MGHVTTIPPQVEHTPFTRRQSMALVFCCTVLGAAAQILMKNGANNLSQPGLVGTVLGIVTSVPLMAGYSLYGISTVLLIFALRDGELSVLYPVIALTYVWVLILSIVFFHESMNPLKGVGVLLIVSGVTVLGKGGAR